MTHPKTHRLRIPLGRGLELYIPKSRVKPAKPKRGDVVKVMDLSKPMIDRTKLTKRARA